MPSTVQPGSPRREELLERAYHYALEHGVADLCCDRSPLRSAPARGCCCTCSAASPGWSRRSSPAHARTSSHSSVTYRRPATTTTSPPVAAELWKWLAADEHRALLTLWVEGYARSLIAPDSAWADFARSTVRDWLRVLADAQPPRASVTPTAEAERTLVLAVLRGAMLDLLATGDTARTTNAVDRQLTLLCPR
jgi:hypothetical protein